MPVHFLTRAAENMRWFEAESHQMNDLMLQNSQLRRHYLITSGTSLIAVIIPRIIRLTAAYVGYDCDAFDLHESYSIGQ